MQTEALQELVQYSIATYCTVCMCVLCERLVAWRPALPPLGVIADFRVCIPDLNSHVMRCTYHDIRAF